MPEETKPKKSRKKGLFNEPANFREEKEEEEDEKGRQTLTNTQVNTVLAIFNLSLAIALISYLGSASDITNEQVVAIFVGLICLFVSTSALVFYSLCHMEPDKFRTSLEKYIDNLQEEEPEFRKHMEGKWWVSRNKWMPNMAAIEEELRIEANAKSKKGTTSGSENESDVEVTKGYQGTYAQLDEDEEEVIDDQDEVEELLDKPVPVEDKRLPVDRKESDMVEMTQVSTPGAKKRAPAITATPRSPEDSEDNMTPRSIIKRERGKHNKSVTFSKEDQESELHEFQVMASLTEADDIDDRDDDHTEDSDITEEHIEFYDELFKKYLSYKFKKWKQPLMEHFPDGTRLVTLDESDLAGIIPTKPVRLRIIKEASKLAKTFKEQRNSRAENNRQETQEMNSFLTGPPQDGSDEEDHFQNHHRSGLSE